MRAIGPSSHSADACGEPILNGLANHGQCGRCDEPRGERNGAEKRHGDRGRNEEQRSARRAAFASRHLGTPVG